MWKQAVFKKDACIYGRIISDHLQPVFACKVWRAQNSSLSYGQWAASAAGASGITSFYTCCFPNLPSTSETYLSWNSTNPCKLSYARGRPGHRGLALLKNYITTEKEKCPSTEKAKEILKSRSQLCLAYSPPSSLAANLMYHAVAALGELSWQFWCPLQSD